MAQLERRASSGCRLRIERLLSRGDIGFFVRPTRANAVSLLLVLNEFGFRDVPLVADDLVVPDRVIQLGRPPNRIDLLTSISGVSFDDASASRVSGLLGEHKVDFIGLDALRLDKTASNRDKDRRSEALARCRDGSDSAQVS